MPSLPPIDLRGHKVTVARNKAKLEWEHLMREGAYAERKDLRFYDPFNFPRWADTALTFFQASEKYERRGGLWSSVLRCTLPRGLSQRESIDLTRRFIDKVLPVHAGFWVLHEPVASDGQPQPHAHILFSSRRLDGIERTPAQFFGRYNPGHPDWGGARKDREHVSRDFPKQLRETWCRMVADMLELAQVEAPPAFPVPPILDDPPTRATLAGRISALAQGLRGRR